MSLKEKFREWVRTWNHCECCNAEVPEGRRFYDMAGRFLCVRCVALECHRTISPGPARWVHRETESASPPVQSHSPEKRPPEVSGRRAYSDQDLDDLMERWRRDMRNLSRFGGQENQCRVQESFDCILEYIHAGEVPRVDGPDRVLVKWSKEGTL